MSVLLCLVLQRLTLNSATKCLWAFFFLLLIINSSISVYPNFSLGSNRQGVQVQTVAGMLLGLQEENAADTYQETPPPFAEEDHLPECRLTEYTDSSRDWNWPLTYRSGLSPAFTDRFYSTPATEVIIPPPEYSA